MADALVPKHGRDQKRGATVEYVVDHLVEGILRGRIAPGQRLVARDLTEEIGIGRGSVREAFRLMAAEGLVDLVPNRGAAVRRLSRGETGELFQIREVLEGLAARLAASRIDEGDNRQVFEAIWRKLRTTGHGAPWDVFTELNRLFHLTIVRIGGNRQLEDAIDKLQLPIMMVQVGRLMDKANVAASEIAHGRIADAILAGDVPRAELAMQRHLRELGAWVLSLPETAFKRERANGP